MQFTFCLNVNLLFPVQSVLRCVQMFMGALFPWGKTGFLTLMRPGHISYLEV